jgi:hypothetical protein
LIICTKTQASSERVHQAKNSNQNSPHLPQIPKSNKQTSLKFYDPKIEKAPQKKKKRKKAGNDPKIIQRKNGKDKKNLFS